MLVANSTNLINNKQNIIWNAKKNSLPIFQCAQLNSDFRPKTQIF